VVVQVQDLVHLLDELRVGGELELLLAVGLQPERLPRAPHRVRGDTQVRGQRAGRPVGRIARLLLQRHHDHPLDVVVDGSDNFPTRYLANDACVLLGKPLVYGSVYRFEGQASVFDARRGPCYRCLFPQPPDAGSVPSCEEGGVLGVLPGLIGMVQATETIKLIAGVGEPLFGRLLTYDALAMRFCELKLRKDTECPVCGRHPSITTLSDSEAICGTPGLRAAAGNGALAAGDFDITPHQLEKKLAQREQFELLDVRNSFELQISALPYSKHIPVTELPTRWTELDKDKDTVVYCRSGARSTSAVSLLQKKGFTKVKNLAGGILAWIDDIDPTLRKY